MIDERAALPSASSAGRYFTCPGSFLLEQQVTDPERSSEDANVGNKIHAWLAGEPFGTLTDDQRELALDCVRQRKELAESVLGVGPYHTRLEVRLWFYDELFNKSWSGKPDVIYARGNRALIIDYKTGRGSVENAVGNLQLRALAVLLAESDTELEEITVAIIQPLAGEPSTCTYVRLDLDRARVEINKVMARVKRPGQPRVPSTDACKYCRAKTICPEAQAVVETLPATVQKESGEIMMSPDQIAAFLDKIPLAEAVIESVRGKARRILEAGGAIPGWKLKPGAVRESITRPEVVFGRFVQAGGTQEQFAGAITITKTKFRDAVKTATGSKGKALDELVEGLLEDCTEQKANPPSIIKEKANE